MVNAAAKVGGIIANNTIEQNYSRKFENQYKCA